MPDVYNPNVVQADLIHVWDGQRVINTLYFYSPVEPGGVDLDDLATALTAYWQTNMLPLMSAQVSFLLSEVTKLEPVPSQFASSSATSPNTGGNLSPALPNSVTIAVSFRTGLTGRSYRGRNYWLGLTEGDVVNNEIGPLVIADILTAYGGLIGVDALIGGWTWVVYSRSTGGVPRETGLPTPVDSVSITDFTIDSQRRRLPGRGR